MNTEFIHSFDFVKMRADDSFVLSGVPKGAYCRGMSQPGEQYALYHHHSDLAESTAYYITRPGNYRETMILNLPAGTYRAEWVDPASGAVLDSASFSHKGGNQAVTSPEHSVDIALRIRRNAPTAAARRGSAGAGGQVD